MRLKLPPEWYPQDAVMLTWPHAGTDWVRLLDRVEQTYIKIACEVLSRQSLVVICHSKEVEQRVQRLLSDQDAGLQNLNLQNMSLQNRSLQNLVTAVIECNDTWARDHGPLTVVSEQGEATALDFTFTGWGGKYASELDNAITAQLVNAQQVLARYKHIDLVLEGGGIEVDGRGHLLATTECLLNPNRNPSLTKSAIENRLKDTLGVDKILWLENGSLEGDDTDAHIDTLARFAPDDTIVYVQSNDVNDSHYDSLNAMQSELQGLKNRDGDGFRLIPLPMAEACYNEEGDRLPATYANFLVINGAVLVPTYNQPETDTLALKQVQQAFPQHEIVGIDCTSLIQQFGSLHCISMQLPRGFLK